MWNSGTYSLMPVHWLLKMADRMPAKHASMASAQTEKSIWCTTNKYITASASKMQQHIVSNYRSRNNCYLKKVFSVLLSNSITTLKDWRVKCMWCWPRVRQGSRARANRRGKKKVSEWPSNRWQTSASGVCSGQSGKVARCVSDRRRQSATAVCSTGDPASLSPDDDQQTNGQLNCATTAAASLIEVNHDNEHRLVDSTNIQSSASHLATRINKFVHPDGNWSPNGPSELIITSETFTEDVCCRK